MKGILGCVVLLATFVCLAGCVDLNHATPVSQPESMVIVPAGWFLMGQNDGRASNRPQRSVYLDIFAIDRTEVTNADFAQFVAATGYLAEGWDTRLSEARPDSPAVGILWRGADAFCRWVGKRLPTEAEWEKAARGTDGRRYPWGDAWDNGRANTAESLQGDVVPVGRYPDGASPYGALDMAGNAAEWVADYFDFDYYMHAPDRNPRGPDVVMDHGLRSGSWASPREHAQTFFRDSSHSARPNLRVGLRCAWTSARSSSSTSASSSSATPERPCCWSRRNWTR